MSTFANEKITGSLVPQKWSCLSQFLKAFSLLHVDVTVDVSVKESSTDINESLFPFSQIAKKNCHDLVLATGA